MEESPPKRRRVSPDPNAPPPARPTEQLPAIPPISQSPSRRIRPSFASPTRASLARFNPEILERRRTASASPFKTSGPAIRDPTTETNQPGNTGRQTERTPGRAQNTSTGLAGPPRSTPSRPTPRPLPPPAPEGDDELNPFLGRMQRRSPDTGIPIPPPPEPELPPAVSDPVSSTPPRGIHSSPRWRDRDKGKKRSPLKSSPLKPRVDSPSIRRRDISQSPYRRNAGHNGPLQDLGLNANTSVARQVPAFQKHASKIKERDRLRKEIATLQREIEAAAQENERIRVMQRAGRVVAPANEEDVLNLVQKTLVATGTPPSPGLSHQMTQAALNPRGILPFGPPTLVARPGDGESDDADIKSHHPVAMSAEDELPFLQLFSPFSSTSQVSVLQSVPNQPLRQRRQITLRSRDVPGLFTARIDMVVNAMNLNILALKVLALEPCARDELGPFVNRICSGDCNRTMHHNVGIISWAMAEWYRLAVQRARFWSQLERDLAAKDDYFESVAEMRARPRDDGSEGGRDGDENGTDECHVADLFRLLGQQSFDVAVPEAGPGSAVRLEWKIHLDWTGEAQSKMALFVGIPGKWREADERGVFGKFPELFEDLIEGGRHPRQVVRTIVALLTGM